MTPLGILYSSLTGITLSGFYYLNKKASCVGRPALVIFWIFACHLPIFLAWFLLSMPFHCSARYFMFGLTLIGVTLLGNLLTIRALTLSPLSLIVPVLGLSPVFTSLLGIPLLNEWPTAVQWLGIFLAVLGVLWLYVPKDNPWNILSFWPQFIRERGAPSIAIASFMWALSAPLDKLALREASPSFHAMFVYSGFVGVLFILLLFHKAQTLKPIERCHYPILIITGSLGALSYVMQLLALQNAAAGPFEAIKRVMSQVLAMVFGYFLFDETISPSQIIGIIVLSFGVPLIVL